MPASTDVEEVVIIEVRHCSKNILERALPRPLVQQVGTEDLAVFRLGAAAALGGFTLQLDNHFLFKVTNK
jgi:hypothetical protein